jgi:sugar phosphate isomerase/epimerase
MENLSLSLGANTLTQDFWVNAEMLRTFMPVCKRNGITALEVPYPALRLNNPISKINDVRTAFDISEVSICHFYAGDAPDPLDSGEEESALASLRSACDFANLVAAKKVVGPLGIHIGKEGGTVEQVTAYMKKAAAIAEHYGITLCMEPLRPHEDKVLNGFDGAIEVVDAVGSKYVKIHYDSFHCYHLDLDPCATIAKIGSERLGHVHISGSDRLPPGLDKVDWNMVFAGLRNVSYAGAVVLELFGPGCREEIPGIADEGFPRSLDTETSIKVSRFTLERHNIIAPLAG